LNEFAPPRQLNRSAEQFTRRFVQAIMKRSLHRLILFGLAASACLCGCARNSKTSQPVASQPPILELSFCDVVAKPDNYDGKILRLHAVFSFGIHGPTIGDRGCSTVDNITWANLSPAKWDELSHAAQSAYGAKDSPGAFDLVAVGKFSRNAPSGGTDLWKDRAPFQFEVLSVERITPHS
jgi:hypothetical protein